jgi:iron complex transport system permease protein
MEIGQKLIPQLAIIVLLTLLGFTFNTFMGHSLSLSQVDEIIPVLLEIRLPRSLIAFFAGASFALAGIIIQTIFKNPLCSPSILGLNSCASLAVCLNLAFSYAQQPIGVLSSSLLGTILGAMALFFMGRIVRFDLFPHRLTLTGICLGFFMSSLTHLVVIMDENTTQSLLFWLLGGVDGKTNAHLMVLMITFFLGLIPTIILNSNFNALVLGDEMAQNLGTSPVKTRRWGIIISVILISGSVAACGPIAFIGLIIPHLCKKITHQSFGAQLLIGPILGGSFLLFADLISRMIQFPFETPVGIVSGIIGAVYFLFLSITAQDKSNA